MGSAVRWKQGGARPSEKIVVKLAGLSRAQLKQQLLSMRARFRMDFTKDYLDSLTKDELRHIALAAHLHAR